MCIRSSVDMARLLVVPPREGRGGGGHLLSYFHTLPFKRSNYSDQVSLQLPPPHPPKNCKTVAVALTAVQFSPRRLPHKKPTMRKK